MVDSVYRFASSSWLLCDTPPYLRSRQSRVRFQGVMTPRPARFSYGWSFDLARLAADYFPGGPRIEVSVINKSVKQER